MGKWQDNILPRKVSRVLVLAWAAGFIPVACDIDTHIATRTFDEFVIQVDIVPASSRVFNPPMTELSAQVTGAGGLHLVSNHKTATPEPPYLNASLPADNEPYHRPGTYYLVFAAHIQPADISTITFKMPGYDHLTIDYQAYTRKPYTPKSATEVSLDRKSPCASYNVLGADRYGLPFSSYIQFVRNGLAHLNGTAVAAAPLISECHLIFRPREEIKITLTPS